MITGSVIGHITDFGKIIIDSGAERPTPPAGDRLRVTALDVEASDTAQMWIGSDFKFRAVGGKFTILVYGSHVNLVARRHRHGALAGHARHADAATASTRSNGSDFRSLPGVADRQRSSSARSG